MRGTDTKYASVKQERNCRRLENVLGFIPHISMESLTDTGLRLLLGYKVGLGKGWTSRSSKYAQAALIKE